jgi:hypothetical protein
MDSYLREIILGIMKAIATLYDKEIVRDQYGLTLFKDGKFFELDSEDKWKEYNNKKCIDDMVGDLEGVVEELRKEGLEINYEVKRIFQNNDGEKT